MRRSREALKIVAGRVERIDIGQLDAVDPFERQDVARRQLPLDLRDAEAGVVGGRLGHLRERRSLEAQVHLDRNGAGERIDDCDRPQPPRRGIDALDQPRAGIECVEVAAEPAPDAGAQHLDRDRPHGHPVRAGDFALCTWAIEAAATGGEKETNRSSTGLPSAAAIVARASASGNGAISSRRRPSVSDALRPTMSGRVARNWPSLT